MGTRPSPSSEGARTRMRLVKRRDTRPETALRSLLHRAGYRFRVDCSPMAGARTRADIVFRGARVAVFVDGCFWHGCPRHGTWPKANADFWRMKIDANRRRDADTTARLRRLGWRVVRVWEHESVEVAAARVQAALRAAGKTGSGKRAGGVESRRTRRS